MDARIVKAVEREGLGRRLKDVLIVCYDKIVAGEIVSVAELLSYLEELGWDPRLEKIIRRSYRLIREIHWGIFKALDPETHPDLWKALTITNRTMPDVADIKRNVIVPNVYCALLDIHAYTEFCQKNRHNTSMLRTLDDVIQRDTREVADAYGCLATRTAGDSIIIVGSSAADIVHATLGAINIFSRKRIMKAASLSQGRRGKSVVMQDFHVSAGIAGGLHYNSMIVTQDGDISGSVVNTAARLQSFANTLAPDRSKVMVASHVSVEYAKEARTRDLPSDELHFFDCGRIGFKGVEIGVSEVLYLERERKKIRYQQEYLDVLEATQRGLWNDQLVPNAARLVARVLETNPVSRIEAREQGMKTTYSNGQLMHLCEEAARLYESAQDHREVSGRLQHLVELLHEAPGFDPLVFAHFSQIASAYDQMVREFEAMQYEKIIDNQVGLFSAKERSLIDHAARLERIRDALIERGKQDNNIYSPTMLWKKIVSDFERGWSFDLYSGKR